MTRKSGFTFIELLVSVTIILVISTFALVSFRSANKKARDDRRAADLEQIRAALELYRVDYDTYPAALVTLTEGSEPYLSVVPDDPVSGLDYYYNQISDYSYEVCAYLESTDPGTCSAGCGEENCNYKLRNP
ncbi:MAG: type II secretion system protein [Candidatus Shapirobacteria bacterium]